MAYQSIDRSISTILFSCIELHQFFNTSYWYAFACSPNDGLESLVKDLLLRGEGRKDIVEGELLPDLPGSLALDDGHGLVSRRGRNDGERPVLLFCCIVCWCGGSRRERNRMCVGCAVRVDSNGRFGRHEGYSTKHETKIRTRLDSTKKNKSSQLAALRTLVVDRPETDGHLDRRRACRCHGWPIELSSKGMDGDEVEGQGLIPIPLWQRSAEMVTTAEKNLAERKRAQEVPKVE